jgi:cytochrome c oxidase subunit 2
MNVASAAQAPLNYFLHSAGPATAPVLVLGWVFTAICGAVCAIIAVLLFCALRRAARRRGGDDIVTGDGGGVRWITIGTMLSTAVLSGMVVYTMIVMNRVATPPRVPALTIAVTGHDWWWQVVYEDSGTAQRVETANEIHIPVGVPVALELRSADVIHGFWVPQLAGKTQMIPGLVNRQWMQADKPGRYRGTCVQFCGMQHAHMGLEVVAQERADFARWLAQQRRPAAPPQTAAARAGQDIFMRRCAACHAVRGTAATGQHGPDLTHLQSRALIAGAMLPNDTGNLRRWIAHPQGVKPGVNMPDMDDLPPADINALVTYLRTLE